MIRITAPLARLYFNLSGVSSRIWSIDLGDGSAEIEVGQVTIDALGFTRHDFNQTNKDLPNAWIEFNDAEITLDLLNSAASIS